jgi:hypothetical protein
LAVQLLFLPKEKAVINRCGQDCVYLVDLS